MSMPRIINLINSIKVSLEEIENWFRLTNTGCNYFSKNFHHIFASILTNFILFQSTFMSLGNLVAMLVALFWKATRVRVSNLYDVAVLKCLLFYSLFLSVISKHLVHQCKWAESVHISMEASLTWRIQAVHIPEPQLAKFIVPVGRVFSCMGWGFGCACCGCRCVYVSRPAF